MPIEVRRKTGPVDLEEYSHNGQEMKTTIQGLGLGYGRSLLCVCVCVFFLFFRRPGATESIFSSCSIYPKIASWEPGRDAPCVSCSVPIVS